MKFKIIIFFLVILTSCETGKNVSINNKLLKTERFSNKGFALIYNDKLYKNKVINKKMQDRDLLIFQKNLRKGTSVKITNPFNDKTILAKVGSNSNYPNFNNSVVSIRIANELNLDLEEPYIYIDEIIDNNSFIAKKTKIYDEEKKVADKAPVDTIKINDLNNKEEVNEKVKKSNKIFNYQIKIADFYYLNTAKIMVDRIKNELFLKNVSIQKLSQNKYRVLVGPFTNINSLQNTYNSVQKLKFENIEIIKND